MTASCRNLRCQHLGRWLLRTAVLAALLAGAASSARAQKQTPSAGVAVEQRYDDNVLLRGESDFVTRVSPNLGYRLEGRTSELSLRYHADLLYFAQGAADLTVGHRATALGRLQATRRLALKIIDRFAWAYDPATLDRPAVVQLEGAILLNFLYFGGEYQLARRQLLQFGYQGTIARFDSPALVSGDEHTGFVNYLFRATRFTDVGGGLRSQVFTADGQYAGAALAPVAIVRRRLTRRWRVEAEGGLSLFFAGSLDADVPGLPTEGRPDPGSTTLSWRASASLVWESPRWLAALRYGRDLLGGGGLEAVLWAQYVGVEINWRIWRGLFFATNARYYQNGVAPNGEVALTGVLAEGGLQYRTRFGFFAGFGAAHLSQDIPGGETFGLTRNIVSIRVGYTYAGRVDGLGREVP